METNFEQRREEINTKIVELKREYRSINADIKDQFTNIIKEYTDKDFKINLTFSTDGFYFEIEFLEPNGNRIFGSDVCGGYLKDQNISRLVSTDLRTDMYLHLNVSTAGMFNIKDIYQVEKYKLIGKLLNDADKIQKQLKKVNFIELNHIKEKWNDLARELNNVDKEEIQSQKDYLENQLTVGTKLKRTASKEPYSFIVSKITKAFIWLKHINGAEIKFRKNNLVEEIFQEYYKIL